MTIRPLIGHLWIDMSKKEKLGFHPKKAITQTAKEYGSQATVHGINYVSDSSSPLLDRCLWLVVVVIFSMSGIILSLQSYYDWQDDPVITTVATTGNIEILKQFDLKNLCIYVEIQNNVNVRSMS